MKYSLEESFGRKRSFEGFQDTCFKEVEFICMFLLLDKEV